METYMAGKKSNAKLKIPLPFKEAIADVLKVKPPEKKNPERRKKKGA